MDRRSFLALLGSAPLAALAPMPHFLPTPVYKSGTAVASAMRLLDGEMMQAMARANLSLFSAANRKFADDMMQRVYNDANSARIDALFPD